MRAESEDYTNLDINNIGEFDIISNNNEEYILKEKDFNNNEFEDEDAKNENDIN